MTSTTEELMTSDELFALPRTEVPVHLVMRWQEAADNNTWIRHAWDPTFDGTRVRICDDRRELLSWLAQGSWSNGSAFALTEGGQWLCFMQQGECSDEWLVVKSVPTTFKGRPAWMHLEFESISWHYIITRMGRADAETMLDDLAAATLDECKSGAYKGAAERKRAGTDTYQVTGPSGMRHKVAGAMPDSDTAVKMWNGDVKPALVCGRALAKVVNFYQGDELTGSYACSKCFPPDPTLPKGAVVVVQLTNTQVVLTKLGFYARCQRCPWVTEEIFHARHAAQQAAQAHEGA